MNVLLVSHCDFDGNSAFHVYSVAEALASRGYAPTVSVPSDTTGVSDIGQPPFPVLTYAEVVREATPYDLVHAWTPREPVRRIAEMVAMRSRCPYVVHLEDNERVVTSDMTRLSHSDLSHLPEPFIERLVPSWASHPMRAQRFLGGAAGITVIVDALLELCPSGIPARVVWPGFDRSLVEASVNREDARAALGVADETLVILYPGNVHRSNAAEVQSLFLAALLLRRSGLDVKLIKTGADTERMKMLDGIDLSEAVTDLGFVTRKRIGELLCAADLFVQPGAPSPFNDYRFPSKIPEFLASERPLILPRTNIGLHLKNHEQAVMLDSGTALDTAEKIAEIAADDGLAVRLARNGRVFAYEHLTWEKNVEIVAELYESVGKVRRPSQQVPLRGKAPHVPSPPVKMIAFYLPQFHPIPENDAWWGEGFTEWTNVTKARPLFEGHYHPQLPTELGCYDLRDPTIMDRQASLAREYGIYGFCFYYYWFDGQRVLEKPLDMFLSRRRPEIPFCYCWANENWTRRWDGSENEILLRQGYRENWAERLIRDVLPAMADPRYLRVGDAAPFLVYRADQIPDAASATRTWRKVAMAEAGLNLHLVAVQQFRHHRSQAVRVRCCRRIPTAYSSLHSKPTRNQVSDLEFLWLSRGTIGQCESTS